MRLIVEKLDGEVFVYFETESQYRKNENDRIDEGSRRLPAAILSQESDLSAYADYVHFVFTMEGQGDEDGEASEDFDCDEPRGVRDCRWREDR